MELPATNFVLVVDNNGDMDIMQLSYDTLWKDLCVMLQVKFEYEEIPTFTYTDDEEEYICLDSQESYDEALKICQANSDVLHVQIRKKGTPSLASQTQRQDSTSQSNHYQLARNAIGSSLGWVRSALNRRISTESSPIPPAQPNAELFSNEITTEVSKEMNSILQSLNRSRDQSLSNESQTSVKEPIESQSADISISTSALSIEDDREEEMVANEPVVSVRSPKRPDGTKAMDSIISRKIKEEVQSAVAKELSAFRQQITDELLSKSATSGDDIERPSTSRDMTIERPRSPTEIKLEIKKLKQEMKKAKHFKKLMKLEEKSREILKQNQDETVVSIPDQPVKIRKFAASFICENFLDGSCIGVGQQFVKYWVLKNEGSITWNYRIELRLIEEKSTDDGSSVDPESIESGNGEDRVSVGRKKSWGAEKNSIPMPTVETGNTAVIAVSHFAPKFPCVYTSAWRLCHGDKLFGPRIWCKVAVKSCIETHPGSLQDESLLSREGHSFTGHSWLGSGKESTNVVEQEPAGDELSQMLSFEMTAVGDFNKETTEEPEEDYNVRVSSPTKSTSLKLETPKKDEEQDKVNEEEADVEEPISILIVEDTSIPQESNQLVVEENNAAQDEKEEEIDEEEEEEIDEEEEEEIDEEEEESAPSEEVTAPEDQIQVEFNFQKEQDEFDDVTNDASSDVPSEFEIIPLPECFDTSKPLIEKFADDEQSESQMFAPSHLGAEESIAVEPTAPPASIRSNFELVVEDSAVTVISEDFDTHSGSSNVAEASPKSPSTAPTPTNQSTLTQLPQPTATDATLPKSVGTPAPVPQSVLDADKPYPLRNYDDGYVAPVQKVAPSQDPLILHPIPLPRGVLDADQPWIKPNPVPSPHPRSNSASQPSTSQETASPSSSRHCPKPSTNPARPTTSSESLVNAPTVLYPSLADPNDEEEVYSLAPETPSMGPRLPILVPPGYRVPNSTPPSEIALLPVETPAVPDQIPRGAPENLTPLEQLVDMGFLDIELNEDLLKEFQGNVNKVVNALVYRTGESRTSGRSRTRLNNGSFLA